MIFLKKKETKVRESKLNKNTFTYIRSQTHIICPQICGLQQQLRWFLRHFCQRLTAYNGEFRLKTQ